MVGLDLGTYSRERALADGLLVDAGELGRELGIPCPVAVSAALWGHPEVAGRAEHLGSILEAGIELPWWRSWYDRIEFLYGVLIDRLDYVAPIHVRVVVERCPAHGVVATFLEEGETYDLRWPRAGSFYLT